MKFKHSPLKTLLFKKSIIIKLFLLIFFGTLNIKEINATGRYGGATTERQQYSQSVVDDTFNFSQKATYNEDVATSKTANISYENIEIYTNYLPPSDTQSGEVDNKHILAKCNQSMPIEIVGEGCMYDIVKVINNASSCPSGTKCLKQNVFEDSTSKNLKPKKCEGITAVNKENCLQLETLKYCYQIDQEDPILGDNCKLPPCPALPNYIFRRPGVNCLADCSSTDKKQIYSDKYFIEGVNCLTSCTSQTDFMEGKCVLKFLDYVMPYCNFNPSDRGDKKFYNIIFGSQTPRTNCMDIDHAEKKSTSGISFGETTSAPFCGANIANNCIKLNNDSTDYCFHKDLSPETNCKKLQCSKLSPNELKTENGVGCKKNSLNVVTIPTDPNFLKSNSLLCSPSPYNHLSYQQIAASTYLNNYTLINKPCSKFEGSFFDTKILSSKYFTKTDDINIFSTINTHISTYNTSQTNEYLRVDYSADSYLADSNTFKNYSSLFNQKSFCKFVNSVEAIKCSDYNFSSPPIVPYDCNSKDPSILTSCSGTGSGTNNCCPSSPTTENYCYKLNINCNLVQNNSYKICKLNTSQQDFFREEPDKTLSWFFRPYISDVAIKSTGSGDSKIFSNYKINGHAFERNKVDNDKNEGLRLYNSDIKDRGWLNNPSRLGTSDDSTSPGAWSDGLLSNNPLVGLAGLCGVDNSVTRPPSYEGAYFKGEVKTKYSGNLIEHGVYICLRKVSTGGLSNTSCGRRKCRTYSDLVTSSAYCGTDSCRLVKYITNNDQTQSVGCNSDSYHFEMGKPNLAGTFSQPGMIAGLSTMLIPGVGIAGALITSIVGGAMAEEEAINLTKPCLANYKEAGDDMMKNVRVRLFKPDPSINYLCAVIEMRNVNANVSGKPFIKEDEFFLVPTPETYTEEGKKKRVYKKLCFSGKFNPSNNTCEGGINYNDEPESLYVWRAARIVKYTDLPPTFSESKCGTNNNEACNNDNNNNNNNLKQINNTENKFVLRYQGQLYQESSNDNNTPTSNTYTDASYNIRLHIERKDINTIILKEKSDCIKHDLKLSTPVNYGVAKISNSRRLFLPSIKITKKCGDENCTTTLEKVKFSTPTIEMVWGIDDSSAAQSDPSVLFFKKIITINEDQVESSENLIRPNISGLDTSLIQETVILKKEQDSDNLVAKACLYKRSRSDTGVRIDTLIKCVDRDYAQTATIVHNQKNNLDFKKYNMNYAKSELNFFENLASFNNHKTQICQSTISSKNHIFGKPIKLYSGKNIITFESITGTAPSSPASPGTNSLMTPTFQFTEPLLTPISFRFTEITDYKKLSNLILCKYSETNQGYSVCLSRHKCTMLNVECINNQKLYLDELFKNEEDRNQDTLTFLENFRNYCIEELLPECNSLKGLPATTSNSVLNPSSANGFNQEAQGNFFGWENEVCIIQGIITLDDPSIKKYVIQNNPIVPDSTSTYLGKCVRNASGECIIYSSYPQNVGTNQTVRLALPRELGLCKKYTDFPITCPAIMELKNDDSSDPYFIKDLNNVHFSHFNRARGIVKPNNSGIFFAEFDISFPGNMIYGECNGFWKETNVKPYARCESDGRLSTFSNSCERYRCPAKTAPRFGANNQGDYPPSYDSVNYEFLSKKGQFHGYSTWPLQESSDNKINIAIANDNKSCLVGFKRKNSITTYKANYSSINPNPDITSVFYRSLSAENKLSLDSVFGNIASYENGTPPSRKCNQLGQWEQVENSCERITCPPLNFPKPSDENSFDMNDFNIVVAGNLISLSDSVYDNLSTLSKIKFKVTTSVNQSVIYVNPTNSQSFNNIPLKNIAGTSNLTSLASNTDYVFQLSTDASNNKFWKMIANTNDKEFRLLWQKIGGAKFSQGFAHRSSSYFYKPKPNDLEDQSFVEGECQESLGYKHLVGTPKPILFCDTNGNWKNLQNMCISDCSEITQISGNNENHGFSTWSKTSGRIDQSLIISANSCVNGYIEYPYDSPYDEEGDKGDFATNANLELLASDDYDGIANSTDGVIFNANIPNSGTASSYDLKISSNVGNIATAGGVGIIGDFVYDLFNLSTINLNASNLTIWSDIKFASYGRPDYSSSQDLKNNQNCHSDYSRLVIAKKCIGKRSCSLNLSDFTNYDTSLVCESELGNGKNGEITADRNYGSGGGGGGGNISNSAQNGGRVGQLGLNGVSYCDTNFHYENKCVLSNFANQGLKVNLDSPIEILGIKQFDGKSGYATIKQFANSSCTGATTITNFNSAGIHIYTVSGSTANEYCIEYDLAGGGGGGGGAGINRGTDGSAGSKITGKFIVKGGTSINIYVGEGGKSGKTKCIRETFTVSTLINNNSFKNSNFAQLNKVKNLKKLFNHQPIHARLSDGNESKKLVGEIYNKISNIFINKALAELKCGKYANHNEIYTDNSYCSGYDYGSKVYTCDCPRISGTWGVRLFDRINYNDYFYTFCGTACYYDVKSNGDSALWFTFKGSGWPLWNSMIFWNNTVARISNNDGSTFSPPYYSPNITDGTNFLNLAITGHDNVNNIKVEPYRDCGFSGLRLDTTNTCGCNTGRHFNGSSCTINSCTASDITGFSSTAYNYGTTSLSCNQTGYNGTLTVASCTTNGTTNTPTGTCSLNSCTASGITGFTSTAYNYGTTSLSCNQTGYNGTLTVASCTTNGTTNTPTGTCSLNSCTASGITGFTSKSYNYDTTSLSCDQGYSGTLTVASCTTNGTTNTPTGTCSRSCPISDTTYDSSYGFTVVSGDSAVETADKTYTCSSSAPYNGGSASFSCSSSGSLSLTPCSCATNYSYDIFDTKKKCVRKCTITSADATTFGIASTGTGIIFAANDYILNGSDNIYPNSTTSKGASYNCSTTASSGYNGGTVALSCGSDGVISVKTGTTGCTCASGYGKDIFSTGTKCVRKCIITSAVADSFGIASTGTGIIFATNDYILNGSDNIYNNSTTSKGASYNCSRATGYNGGTVALSCGSDGVISVKTGTTGCNCASGYGKDSNQKCTTKCTITDDYKTGFGLLTPETQDYALGETTASIFSSTNSAKTYTCSSTSPYNGGTPVFSCAVSIGRSFLTYKTPCNCATGFFLNPVKKCVRKCTILSTDATKFGIDNFQSDDYMFNGSSQVYTSAGATKSYTCASNVSYSGGSITLDCDSSGLLKSTKGCNCNSGYSFDDKNVCIANICDQVSPGSGLDLRGIEITNWTASGTAIACTKPNFKGTYNYVCGTNKILLVTSNSCVCKEGFYLNPTTLECQAITCRAPATLGYPAKTDLPFTLGTTKNKIFCNNIGYHNHIEYTCKNGTGTNGTFTVNTSAGAPACLKLSCVVPSGSNLSVADQSIQAYGTNLSCKTGYSSISSGLSPSISCSSTYDANTNLSLLISNNQVSPRCEINKCTVPETTYLVSYSPNTETVNCQGISSGWYGTGTYTCNAQSVFTWVNKCKAITCQIPLCNPAKCVAPDCHCPPPPTPAYNTIYDSSLVFYSPTQIQLNCKNGYESISNPKYTCNLTDTSPQVPILRMSGTPCQIITCIANSSLNSIIDSLPVNWTGTNYANTSCKQGYYQLNPNLPPQYKCDNDKNFNSQNPCKEIRCNITNTTVSSFGMKLSSGDEHTLQWTGATSRTSLCNANGFSGNITFTCTGTSATGTLSISNNTCQQEICNRSFGQKNLNTFDNLVSNQVNIEGVGGGIQPDRVSPTIPAFNFLKGGNGGNSSIGFTSGSGGGGGQASMIAINNKIIAIAGGGGGGAGGGSSVNNNLSYPSEISFNLSTPVFGNYLYLKISNMAIFNNEQNTAGVFFSRNSSNQINISAPTGKIINKIEFATLGNPLLTPSLSTSFDLKHGTCRVNLNDSLKICLSESSCSITDLNFMTSGTCQSSDMGVVSSYVYSEPKLRFSNEANSIIIKELVGNQLVSPNIENGKVYSFYKLFEDSNYWIKSSYSVNNIYLVSNSNILNEFRVQFHRTNSSFEPQLKFVYGVNSLTLPIKKSIDQNISIGYIIPNISYVIKNKGSYWEIKKFIPEYANKLANRVKPKRTCRTVKLSNNIARLWSGTSSKCINKCPSYDYDNRIGAGATLHRGTNNVFRKVKWPEANFNSNVILKIDASSFGADNTFNSFNGSILPNQFTGNENFFIVSRYCNGDGSWSDPIYLCKISGGSPSDTTSAPPGSINEYLTETSYEARFGTSEKFISANGSVNAESNCLNGFYKDINSGIIYNQYDTKQTSNYSCVRDTNQVNAKLLRNLGTETRCIKYCSSTNIDRTIYDIGDSILYKSNSGNFDVNCKTGYLTGNTSVTSSKHSCNSNGMWNPIAYACRKGADCSVSTIQGSPVSESDGSWAVYRSSTEKSDFFPLKSFLVNNSSLSSMKHGENVEVKRCAYYTYRCGCDCCGVCYKFCFLRKKLSSVSCNDGKYVAVWDTETEADARQTCDNSGGSVDHSATEEGRPYEDFIGYGCNGGIKNASDYGNIRYPGKRYDEETEIVPEEPDYGAINGS